MTLREYLDDYASEDTRKKGIALMQTEVEKIPNEKVRSIAKEYISAIDGGKRDFRF